MATTTIIGLSGSLRAASFNTGLLRAAAGMMPGGSELIVKTIHGIPLFDGDLEDREGIPPAVAELGTLIAQADGLLLSSPEYNNSIPGPIKNAIDWLSRIGDETAGPVFAGKPVAVMGASPGGFGTLLGQNAWLPVLRTLKTQPWWEGRLLVAKAGSLADDDGSLTDATTLSKLRAFLAGFTEFVRTRRAGPELA